MAVDQHVRLTHTSLLGFYRWCCIWSLLPVIVWVPILNVSRVFRPQLQIPSPHFPHVLSAALPRHGLLFPISPRFLSKKSLFPCFPYWFQCHHHLHPSTLTVILPLSLLLCLRSLSFLGWCWSNFRSNFIFVTFCTFFSFLRSKILLNWYFLISRLRLLIKIALFPPFFPTSRHDFLLYKTEKLPRSKHHQKLNLHKALLLQQSSIAGLKYISWDFFQRALLFSKCSKSAKWVQNLQKYLDAKNENFSVEHVWTLIFLFLCIYLCVHIYVYVKI